jgi:class 3 adenylate cyclase/tetratricopeptide (TPR) repeat protein
MQCPRCQQENPPQAKFCLECATPLVLRCANCGTQLPPEAKFCFECAAPIGAPGSPSRFASPAAYTPKHLAERIINSKAALEGERKQVTVLFADLKGSMELLADRDPEEARKLLDPVLERMMEAVHHYEGTVNQVMGDGIMALFGAPLGHEDHAVRACYAALRMQESVKKYAEEVQCSHAAAVKIRLGLNSGEVVVRAIGSDLHMDYTAVGQTTHLAARMEQIADPGAIVITADTLALAEGYVEVKSLGPVPVKGLTHAVAVYELTGAGPARTRLQAGARRGLTRFVGRDAELEQLFRVLEQARQGHGQIVAVVGDPGVGKSRLTLELTHSHRLDGWHVLHAGALPYGKATSYLPLIQLLKSHFRIDDSDTAEEIQSKLTRKIFTLDRALENALPALCALLDTAGNDPEWKALDPAQRRLRILDAVKRLLLREAQSQPLLVVFEDLHWIDSETQAFLEGFVERLPTANLLLLINYRPEYQHRWGGKSYYTELRLDALPRQGADELLMALLGADATVEALKPVLIARTGGNPLFLEENVRALVETNAITGQRGAHRLARPFDTIDIPATVQAILASRIDRLTPEDKRLLQTASVVGKDVPIMLLSAVAELDEGDLGRRLARLQAGEFLYETNLFPKSEYTFKHALTHEVAYGSLLQARRRTLHAQLVGAIERLYPERLSEHFERLAHHASRGGLREKAIHYLRQVGGKAAARSALPEALASFEEALGVLEGLPESRATLEQAFDVRLELRSVLTQLTEQRRAFERVLEAQALAERLNDDQRRGLVYAFMTGDQASSAPGKALVVGTRALEIAARLADLRLRFITTYYLEQAHYWRGDYEKAVELATSNLTLPADRVNELFGTFSIAAYDQNWLVHSLAQLGRFAEAVTHAAEAMRLAEATRHTNIIAIAHYSAGALHLVRGDWMNARVFLEHPIALYRAGNVVMVRRAAICSSAWVLAQLGEEHEAQSRLGEGKRLIEHYAAGGVVGYLSWNIHALGRTCLLLGRLDEAEDLGMRAIESLPEHTGVAAHSRHLLGDIATRRDPPEVETSEGQYRHALAIATELGMRPLVAHCHLGLGKLYRRTGKREQAQEHLTTATTMYREMGMTYWLEKAETEMRELG